MNTDNILKSYSLPDYKTRLANGNERRLICFSTINNENCNYGPNCTYAHSLEDQVIDEERKFIYQIMLDKKLMNFMSDDSYKTDEIYKQLLFMTHICENCVNQKCTGRYNCRNGTCTPYLKLCKNDLLTGECLNKIIDINVDQSLIGKLNNRNFEVTDPYKGCINGHHLSLRGLIPYYKYLHQKENSRKNKYQSVRYIDIDPLLRIRKGLDSYKLDMNDDDSDSSSDEEIGNWFNRNKCVDDF